MTQMNHLHAHSTSTISPVHQQVRQQLIKLCKRVKTTVKRGLDRLLQDLQVESGLKLITTYKAPGKKGSQLGCPQKVLLLPPESLKRIMDHYKGPQNDSQRAMRASSSTPPHHTRDHDDMSEAISQIDDLLDCFDNDDFLHDISSLLDHIFQQLDQPHGDYSCFGDGGGLCARLNDKLLGELSTSLDENPETLEDPETGRVTISEPLAIYSSYPTSQITSHMTAPLPFHHAAHQGYERTHQELGEDIFQSISKAQPHIEYYALKILLCALHKSIHFDSLTRVVRVHELSHLITHLGLDASEHHWVNFHQASTFDVEGSAQELTHRFLDREIRMSAKAHSKGRKQSAQDFRSFHKLLTHQSAPYTSYQNDHGTTPDADERRWRFLKSRR